MEEMDNWMQLSNLGARVEFNGTILVVTGPGVSINPLDSASKASSRLRKYVQKTGCDNTVRVAAELLVKKCRMQQLRGRIHYLGCFFVALEMLQPERLEEAHMLFPGGENDQAEVKGLLNVEEYETTLRRRYTANLLHRIGEKGKFYYVR